MPQSGRKLPPLEPLHDVTWNVTSNKADRFMSVISTHRTPSKIELERADWSTTMRRGALRIHVIGHGDELSDLYLKQLASAYADGLPIWKTVDLSKPEMPVTGFPDSATWREIMAAANDRD